MPNTTNKNMNKIRMAVTVLSALILSAPLIASGHSSSDKKTAAAYQKPGAPVRVIAPGPTSLAVSEEATIEFTVRSASVSPAVLDIRAQEGLSVQHSNTTNIDFSDGPVTLPVTVSADQAGRYYLYFSIDMDGLARNVSYGIDVGDSKTIEASFKPSNPAVGGIKRQKAIETVYQK